MFVKKLTKIKFTLLNWPFFPSDFLDFSPKHHLKTAFFSKIKFTLVQRPFFYLKNDKKWAIFAIFFILLYTDDFFIHSFRQKSNLHQYTGHFFPRIFQFFASNHHQKSALIFKNQIYSRISALFSHKKSPKMGNFDHFTLF